MKQKNIDQENHGMHVRDNEAHECTELNRLKGPEILVETFKIWWLYLLTINEIATLAATSVFFALYYIMVIIC